MKVTGGILAGGQGLRFGGADKGLLPLHGRPFVAHVLDRLAPQVDEVVISANRNASRYAAFGVRVVADHAGCGPLAGLLALLETAAHPWVLCAPCDAVTLPADLRRALQDALWADEADIAVLHDAERAHPACCLVPAGLAPDLRRFLDDGGSAVWQWQSRHRVAYARWNDTLANLNDWSSVAALRAQ